MSRTLRYSVLVSGCVQGVSYRYFVFDAAKRLNVTGWVRNLYDGRVEAELQGEETAVKALLAEMRKGSLASRVTDIAVEDIEHATIYQSFQIR